LSARRRSKGLFGEHKPVECVDAGVLKTIWSSTSKNELCSEQAELFPNASSLKAPLASSESKNEIKDISTLGSRKDERLSLDIDTLLVFVFLPLILRATKFMNLVRVRCFTNFVKFLRKRKVFPSLKKIVGKFKGHFLKGS
jgi:hypothetical protein